MNRFSIFQKTRYRFHSLIAVTALAAGGLAAAAFAVPDAAIENAKDKSAIPAIATVKEIGNAFTAVTKRAAPAVVFIDVEKNVAAVTTLPKGTQPKGMPDFFGDDMLKRFFGDRFEGFDRHQFEMPQHPRRTMGQGSGFIISDDGYILTNSHVVRGADRVNVTLTDGREFEAKIVGIDARSDVAVIKVDAEDLPTLPMGNSDKLEVGEWVLAVGSPFGLSGTVTSGIVSAKGRNSVGIADYEDFIQTDAAINPGNSGGPLLNLDGEVIGINTAIASRTGSYNGIGFAIPISMARDIYHQLVENGSVARGYLGILIQPLTEELAESFGLDAGVDGILVGDVTKDSPAAKAGLQAGDVIVEFAGEKMHNVGAFRNHVAATAPETTVELVVLRDGKRLELDATIGTLPGQDELASANDHSATTLGLTVKPLTDELAAEHGYTGVSGVLIADVESGSAAALAGLKAGEMITEVNRQAVSDVASFKSAMADTADGETVLLRVQQGEHSRYVALRTGK